MKNAQASLEFLLSFSFLIIFLLILGAVSSNHLHSFQKTLYSSSTQTCLSSISFNLGILFSSTNSTYAGVPPAPQGEKTGMEKNIIFSSYGGRLPTLNPGSGGEYAREDSIPN